MRLKYSHLVPVALAVIGGAHTAVVAPVAEPLVPAPSLLRQNGNFTHQDIRITVTCDHYVSF